MLTRLESAIYVSVLVSLILFMTSNFDNYSSGTQETPEDINAPNEDIDSADIWGMFRTADEHVNQTVDAIESGNSTLALLFLHQIRSDLRSINGNVTDLIFSASENPP